jgi:hypothetical protein
MIRKQLYGVQYGVEVHRVNSDCTWPGHRRFGVKFEKTLFGISLSLILIVGAAAPGSLRAQIAPNRVPQQIIVNGQQANGAYVTSASGGVQSYRCPSPQSYTTPDGASHGWACYDQVTATYLLSALPPAQLQAQAQPLPPLPTQAPVYNGSYSNYPNYGYPPRTPMGKVKIDTKIKNGKVYVDGGLAGETRKLKKFSITAGNHDIELRDSTGHTTLKERVQVIAGRTVEIKSAI